MLHVIPAFSRIGEENAFAVLAKAAELQRQGRDIINLGIGQPDFKTPPHIVEAAVKALRDGEHGYTPATGIAPLREAVAADLHRRFGVEVSPDLVLIAPGDRGSAERSTSNADDEEIGHSGMAPKRCALRVVVFLPLDRRNQRTLRR
jgi:hypothetical protein